MIKYFHELTLAEYDAIVHMTVDEVNKLYPQPTWCEYPNAIGALGCWSLTGRLVTGESFCKDCDCYKPLQEQDNDNR